MMKPPSSLWPITAGLLAVFLALVLQWSNGFYTSDLGADPDEAAHAVTSLMVRDYLVEGFGSNPLKFAQDYYKQFPKVALGHYPPLYYATSSLWLLPVRSVAALGCFQAVQAGLLVAVCTWMLGRRVPVIVAGFLATGWSALPYLQKNTVMIMADLQVALLCLGAALALWRFLEKGTWQWSLAFGSLASAAILTKGSGWLLALLPGLSLLFTGEWRWLKDWRFWLAVVPVTVLALPWQLWSTRITERGMTGMTPAEHLAAAIPFYAEALPHALGWSITVVLVIALAIRLWRLGRGGIMANDLAVLWALVLATCVLIVLVPAGLTSRYLMPLYFPALILSGSEVAAAARWIAEQTQWSKTGLRILSLAVLVLSTMISQPVWFKKDVSGFAAAFESARAQSTDDDDLNVLVVSDARGEGAVVAAAAFDKIEAQHVSVLRASKELAEQDWMGRDLILKSSSPTEIKKLLNHLAVDWVLVDKTTPDEHLTSYHKLIDQSLSQPNCGWRAASHQAIHRAGGASGEIVLYQRQPDQPFAQ